MKVKYTWGRGHDNTRGHWQILSYPANENPTILNSKVIFNLPKECEEWQAKSMAALLSADFSE